MTEPIEPAPDPLADRIAQMVATLLPRIRPLGGRLSEHELLEAAAYTAVSRVQDAAPANDDA